MSGLLGLSWCLLGCLLLLWRLSTPQGTRSVDVLRTRLEPTIHRGACLGAVAIEVVVWSAFWPLALAWIAIKS